MELSWSINDIKLNIEKIRTSDSTIELRRLCVYMNMLNDINNTKEEEKARISKDVFFSKLNSFDISYFNNAFFKLISYISTELNNLEFDFKMSLTDKRKVKTIIKMCNDFYKKNFREDLSYFNKIVKNESCINIINYNPKLKFMGRSYIVSDDEYYLLINGRNYLEDCSTIIHECKHIEMYMKGYNNGMALYQELPSILYEMYMIDYLSNTDSNKAEVSLLRMSNIDKYVDMIRKMYDEVMFIKKLLTDSNFYYNLYENYYIYYDKYKLENIYNILNSGYSEKYIGVIISFIVSIDIYLSSKQNNVNNIISGYLFGIYKLKPAIIDKVLEYITSMYKPYQEEMQKSKKNLLTK